MTNEIGGSFMYYDTTKEMLDADKETYSNVDNVSAILETKRIHHDLRHHDLRQGDLSVTNYLNIESSMATTRYI